MSENQSESQKEIPVRSQKLPLDSRPYLERFREMVRDLEAHPAIEITELNINAPATGEDFQKIDQPISEAMKRFYSEANGLTIRWQTKDNDDGLQGDINLLPLEKVFGDWQDIIWFDFAPEYHPLYPLDFFIEEACCCLYMDGSANPGIYYHYCGEEMHSLEVDFAGYIELLLKSRGFSYWPTAIVSDLTGEEYTTEPAEFRRGMPGLFADYESGFFLRHDFAEQDEARERERIREIEEIKNALDEESAVYSIRSGGTGYIDIKLLDNPENLKKVELALARLGETEDLSGNWTAMSIGSYMFDRVSAL